MPLAMLWSVGTAGVCGVVAVQNTVRAFCFLAWLFDEQFPPACQNPVSQHLPMAQGCRMAMGWQWALGFGSS